MDGSGRAGARRLWVDLARRLFGPVSASSGPWPQAVARLVAADPALAAIVDAHGLPPRWTRPAGFPSLVLLILEQQVSLASGAAAYRRVLTRVGRMTPAALLASSAEALRADGVSRQKERYLRALSAAVQQGTINLGALADLDDEAVAEALTALPGIGRWTAHTYLLACLDRPDVWPVGDRALQIAAAETLGLKVVPTPVELEAIGQRWRPHRSDAARLLWHGYLARRGRVETSVDVLGPPYD